MSTTNTLDQALEDLKPTQKKARPKAQSTTKTKAKSKAKTKADMGAAANGAPGDALPEGQEYCYVAIPEMVHRGGGRGTAQPGERLISSAANINQLELRELAFRSESEAHAAFLRYKRKKDAELEARIKADERRRAHRERRRQEMLDQQKIDWQGV